MPDWGDLQEDQLRFMARTWPTEVAYRNLDDDTALTFTQWEQESNQLARGLVSAGISPGDRVAIFLPGHEVLRWITSYAAIHKAGAVVVPTNTRLSAPELITIWNHAEVSAVITSSVMPDSSVNVSDIKDSIPSLVHVFTNHEAACHSDSSEFQVQIALDDLADILYTSGTTGLPKGIAVRHDNVAMIPNNEPVWTGDGWIHGAPMFTFAGLAFIYNPMKMGLTALYHPTFTANRWLKIVEEERPTRAMLVPAYAELIVADPEFNNADLSSLDHVSIGSAPIAPTTHRLLIERMPTANVGNSFGMSEAGPAYIVMPPEEIARRIGSVGKPIGPMEIRIVDEAGNEVAAEVIGELFMRMPGKQREYYKDSSATEQSWTSDGWLMTGDLAYLDSDGYLYICGRKKDVIIRGGNNIYSTDVESVLLEHPSVQEAAVSGIPHNVLGEDVGAWIVLRSRTQLSAEELTEFCGERLADYKCPRQINFVESLPRNATGKVLKHKLIPN